MTDPTNRQRRVGLPRTPPPVGLESVRKAEIRSTALKSRTGGQPVLKSPFRGRKCELGEIGRSERDGAFSLGDTSTADTPVALGRHNAGPIPRSPPMPHGARQPVLSMATLLASVGRSSATEASPWAKRAPRTRSKPSADATQHVPSSTGRRVLPVLPNRGH